MPNSAPDQELLDLIHVASLLIRRARQESYSDELSMTEAMTLSRLARGGPATIAALARAEGIKPQSMGTTIAALEQTGMVQREPHPTDGRQMMIELTEKAVQFRKTTQEARRVWLARALDQLPEDDRQALARALPILRKLGAQ